MLWKCTAVPSANDEITETMRNLYSSYWWFIILRTSEFLETIVFVLRKKQNQVSFLHVYHHIAVVALLWMFLKHNGGRGEAVIVILNTAVHVMMYSYYFFSSFNTLKNATAKFKPLITGVQIVQLVTMLLHCFFVIAKCQGSTLYYLQAGNLALLVFMFMKFYVKSYFKKSNKIA
jgi:hypothetical protein